MINVKLNNLCYNTNYILTKVLTLVSMEKKIEEILITLGQNIKDFRGKRGLSQIDLELKCGVSNADISRIENGKKNVELVTIIKISIALEISIIDLFK